jgi:hypothetical protein
MQEMEKVQEEFTLSHQYRDEQEKEKTEILKLLLATEKEVRIHILQKSTNLGHTLSSCHML